MRPARGAIVLLVLAVVGVLWVAYVPPARHPLPHDVVLFIGDGMGRALIEAARPVNFTRLPHRALVTTHASFGAVTDSAAAATAMATGRKVDNRRIAVDARGRELPTLFEIYARQGRQVGFVTTAFVEDATPAAFAAHAADRRDHADIAADYFERLKPRVVMGGYRDPATPERAARAGYTVQHELVPAPAGRPLAGFYYQGRWASPEDEMPSLSAMTAVALDRLDRGFFLLVENGDIDVACHHNDLDAALAAVHELDRAVALALARPDTLVVVTADHETGGVTVGAGGRPSFTTEEHTKDPVLLFAAGPGAERFHGTLDNTDVFRLLTVPAP